jgi:outer membrane protein assembly factor BamB
MEIVSMSSRMRSSMSLRHTTSHVGGGLTGPVVGRDGRVFIASTASPLLYCLDGRGNDDGTAELLWTYRMGDKVEESVPCLYGELLFILSCDGYLHAVR